MLPAESTVADSDLSTDALIVGLPSGNKSKVGPLRAAPDQCVVSTETIPSETASRS